MKNQALSKVDKNDIESLMIILPRESSGDYQVLINKQLEVFTYGDPFDRFLDENRLTILDRNDKSFNKLLELLQNNVNVDIIKMFVENHIHINKDNIINLAKKYLTKKVT